MLTDDCVVFSERCVERSVIKLLYIDTAVCYIAVTPRTSYTHPADARYSQISMGIVSVGSQLSGR